MRTHRRQPEWSMASGLPGLLLLALLGALSIAGWANADDAEPIERLPEKSLPSSVVREHAYRMNHQHLLQGLRGHVEQYRHAKREERAARRRRGMPRPGMAPRPMPIEAPEVRGPIRRAIPAAPLGALALPGNVRANDPTGDAANLTQAELSLGSIGDQSLVAWNDGKGFTSNTVGMLGLASSANAGAAWSDLGDPPSVAGFAQAWFRGDPCVAVDEKNSRFYVAGLGSIDRDTPRPGAADSSGLVIGRRFLVDGVWQWQTTTIARAVNATNYFLDKEWIAADSSSGAVYLAYVQYDYAANTNSIQFQRSLNTATSFTVPITLSSVADAGDVQGVRVAVGPNGEVHVTWMHNNPATGMFDIRYRRSLDKGLTFGAEQTVVSHVPLSTGPPGFNRTRGVDLPSLAVDRTHGLYRGRVYVGFSEAYDYLDDLWASQPAASTVRFESENNDFFNRADAFSVGNTLRGTVGSGDLVDFWKVTLTAGQHMILWFDSTSATVPATLYFRMYSADTTALLAASSGGLTGDLQLFPCIYTVYAPVSGTYYVRVNNQFSAVPYRIRTKVGSTSGGRGRDRRDPFVTWSQGGSGAWSTPSAVTNGPVGTDDFIPEIAVGPDGFVYAAWMDARDDSRMISTHLYTARSGDGGTTWSGGQRLSEVATDFNATLSNLAPNMGDYLGLAAGPRRVHAAWADGRSGDVDSYTESFLTDAALSGCLGGGTAPVLGSLNLSASVQNLHAYASNSYQYLWVDEHDWIDSVPGTVVLAAGQSGATPGHLTVPANTPQGMKDQVCLTVTNGTGSIVFTCCDTVTVSGSLLAVSGDALSFGLAAPVPNPSAGSSRVRFTLGEPGRVTLALFDLAGARVRTLIDEERRAGRYDRIWDGRDDLGHRMPAGMYFMRLEQGGRRSQRTIVRLH